VVIRDADRRAYVLARVLGIAWLVVHCGVISLVGAGIYVVTSAVRLEVASSHRRAIEAGTVEGRLTDELTTLARRR